MIKVHTESGSIYEFDMENLRMRRIPKTKAKKYQLRQDKDWLQMLIAPEIEEGYRIGITLQGLHDPEEVTFRTTTRVTKIEGDE